MVDRNLFAHDLAIAAILKNEGHYIKEWLDYHLLAGVDHFYLYDNDSTD
ncbi:MAG: glycosyltransferase family 2 protein, partial [Selenomonadaceae bacterium]|nr:glycosyltransferase family 2 protein [Selenomonadaceae bacterium]